MIILTPALTAAINGFSSHRRSLFISCSAPELYVRINRCITMPGKCLPQAAMPSSGGPVSSRRQGTRRYRLGAKRPCSYDRVLRIGIDIEYRRKIVLIPAMTLTARAMKDALTAVLLNPGVKHSTFFSVPRVHCGRKCRSAFQLLARPRSRSEA